jgi:hypothetical protein
MATINIEKKRKSLNGSVATHRRVDIDLPKDDVKRYAENIIRRNKQIFDQLANL